MTDSDTRHIGEKVADGAKVLLGLRLAERLIGLASFSILARLLLPEDFGLVALAMSAIAIIELFGHAGIDLALIQKRDVTQEHYDTAWSINALIGLGIAIVIGLAAPLIAIGLGDPRIESLLYWLAAASLLNGLYNVGTADFRKKFQFGKEFRFRFLTRITRAVVGVGLALLLRDYRALVAAQIAGVIAMVAYSYMLHPYRPRFSLSRFASFKSFSGWLLIRNIVAGLNEHVVNLVVGRFTGAISLGFFSVAREISSMATSELQAPIRRALFPGFSALRHESDRLRMAYLRWTGMMVLLGLPIPVGVALVAHDIVLVLLGERWLPAVAFIQLLACAGVFRAFASGAQSVLIAIGRPDVSTKLVLTRFAILIPSVAIGVYFLGALGAAWAVLATAAVMYLINVKAMMYALDVGLADMAGMLKRPVIASTSLAVSVGLLYTVWQTAGTGTSALRLFASGVLGACVYAVTLYGVWRLDSSPPGPESEALAYLKRHSRWR